MKIPRRQPRAVYEVYDAEQMLGGHDGLDSFEPGVDRDGGAFVEQPAPAGEPERAHAPARAPEPAIRSVFLRMLAGATLCLAAVCAIAAIAIVLLHTLEGAGRARPRSARPPAAATTLSREPGVDRRSIVNHPRRVAARLRPAVAAPPRRAAVAHGAQDLRPAPRAALRLNATAVPVVSLAPQSATPDCLCTSAEAEFGFER